MVVTDISLCTNKSRLSTTDFTFEMSRFNNQNSEVKCQESLTLSNVQSYGILVFLPLNPKACWGWVRWGGGGFGSEVLGDERWTEG